MKKRFSSQFKFATFQLFFNFRHFFQLCYYPVLFLCFGGGAIATMLHLVPDSPASGLTGMLLFGFSALGIMMTKHYYTTVLAWSDTRDKTNTITPLR